MPEPTPFRCHIFVCINDRQGARKSCADGGSTEIARVLKERLRQRYPDSVRVSRSLCMGRCAEGPNLMIYPQGLWYSGVGSEDIDAIVDQIDALLTQQED